MFVKINKKTILCLNVSRETLRKKVLLWKTTFSHACQILLENKPKIVYD